MFLAELPCFHLIAQVPRFAVVVAGNGKKHLDIGVFGDMI